MDKLYSPQQIEASWYQHWESRGYFKPRGQGEPYCIMLPPPNVTGSLHMGHGFQHTLMDALTRYHRMQGQRTLWQPGTDHAGISTQLVVENQLAQQGIKRQDLTRDGFMEKVWSWKETSGSRIKHQMQQLGASADWSRERFTLDESLSFAVKKVFIQLYEEGLIYRGTRLVNWDPVLGTAVSDLEVIASEEEGSLWYIRYPLVESDDALVVATTRPETLLGDVAVAVHPHDARYQHLIGRMLQLPLCNRQIPIIADAMIDPDFGSGCVKVTPAHDFNDYAIGKRHELPLMTVFTLQGTLNQHAPEAYQGLPILAAREKILQDLTTLGLLVKVDKHLLKVPRGEKSNAIIEPLLTDQWYIQMAPLAKPAIEAAQQNAVRFVPESWQKTYFQWMENIEDWCISRQLWWGHRIPAWYDAEGHVYVGYDEPDVRFKYHLAPDIPLQQDDDVLDTWFSSALWPFTTLGWPEKTVDLQTFYPTQVLVTGFDIIFFWVARMIMMGLKFTGQVPFTEVLVTGLIRDSEGHKMSKSKGNVLDPMDIIYGISLPDLIQKRTENLLLTSKIDAITQQTKKEFPNGIAAFGVDPLRFTYCALFNLGRNIRFDLQRVEGTRNFCNKIWNAARFIIMKLTPEFLVDRGDEAIEYSAADLWIQSCLQQVIDDYHEHFRHYRFDRLANTLYDFIWHEFCDWYIEFVKIVLHDHHVMPSLKRGTLETLVTVFDAILHLLHPLMPFITEEISAHLMQTIGQERESLMFDPIPISQSELRQPALEQEFSWLKALIQTIRTLRSEIGVAPGTAVPLILKHVPEPVKKVLMQHQQFLIQLGKLTGISISHAHESVPISASAVVGTLELFIPLAGLIHQQTEITRLEKELKKLEKEIHLLETKLSQPHFIEKAPASIIEKERGKLAQSLSARDKLTKHKKRIEAI